jgi:hypothetical protein
MLKQHNEMYGSDDWLAQEIVRESRISAWDMDGGRILRQEHENNCDAARLRAEHALDCDAREVAREHREEHMARDTEPAFSNAVRQTGGQKKPESQQIDGKKIMPIMIGLFVMTIFIPYLAFLIPPVFIALMISAARKNR